MGFLSYLLDKFTHDVREEKEFTHDVREEKGSIA